MEVASSRTGIIKFQYLFMCEWQNIHMINSPFAYEISQFIMYFYFKI